MHNFKQRISSLAVCTATLTLMLFLLGLSNLAHAIPIKWTLDGMLFQGGTVTGSFIYDADLDVFSSSSLISSVGSPSGGLVFTDYVGDSFAGMNFQQAGVLGLPTIGLSLRDIMKADLTNAGGILGINTGSSQSFAEYNCSSFPCNGNGTNVSNWKSSYVNTLTGVAVSVPEPETLALFGLGLIGLAFTKRKKNA